MCQFLSAIVTRKGDIFQSPWTDSHEDLIKIFNLKEGRSGQNFVRVEFKPPRDDKYRPKFFDFKNYKLYVDERETPAWFDDATFDKTQKRLNQTLKSMLVTDKRDLLIGGAYIIGKGADVKKIKQSRILVIGDNAKVSEILDNTEVGYILGRAKVEHVKRNVKIGQIGERAQVKYLSAFTRVEHISNDVKVVDIGGNVHIGCISNRVQVSCLSQYARVGQINGPVKITTDKRTA